MRMEPGVMRELHWHATAAEWAFVTEGGVRTTVIDPQGCAETNDFVPGDIWYFPRGHGHVIETLGDKPCHFILVFDNGYFSEFGTFSISDWIGHAPKELLAKNFGVPESAFANIPKEELYIFESQVPGPLDAYRVVGAGPVPTTYSHKLMDQKPIETKGGRVRIVDSSNFPAAKEIAAALVEVEPGGMRELHWHPNSDELQYHISGQSRMTVFASGATAGTFDYQPGDVGYVPRSMPHYIENTGSTTLRFLELWKTDRFSDISLAQWLAFTPYELVRAHLKIDKSVLAKVTAQKTPVVPG